MSKSIPETNAHQFSFHCNPDGAVRLDDKSDLHSSPRLLEFQTSAHKSLSLSYRTGGAVCTPADPVHAGSANRRAVRRGRDELSAGEAAVPHSSPMAPIGAGKDETIETLLSRVKSLLSGRTTPSLAAGIGSQSKDARHDEQDASILSWFDNGLGARRREPFFSQRGETNLFESNSDIVPRGLRRLRTSEGHRSCSVAMLLLFSSTRDATIPLGVTTVALFHSAYTMPDSDVRRIGPLETGVEVDVRRSLDTSDTVVTTTGHEAHCEQEPSRESWCTGNLHSQFLPPPTLIFLRSSPVPSSQEYFKNAFASGGPLLGR
ncbi:hypothetical protein FA13DRAFT_1714502 [Coprinellus micaceus]|uniref:Uncharacterized protein n=1 Tax=Coprinellus micaceus TaxID=71717 RepID=A0A4Y7SSQ2_COPMI|nr:hypothetical protein FA13DRAFT_1714502 [Coprinellus micaceus]